MNRRHFIAATAATTAVLGGGLLAPAARAAGAPELVLYRERHPAARRLAEALAVGGAVPLPMGDDARPQWYHDLGAALAAGARSLAGAAGRSEYLIAESVARRHGLRLRYHGLHVPQSGGALAHALRLPVTPAAWTDGLALGLEDWPREVAAMMLTHAGDGPPASSPLQVSGRHAGPSSAPLLTWLFA